MKMFCVTKVLKNHLCREYEKCLPAVFYLYHWSKSPWLQNCNDTRRSNQVFHIYNYRGMTTGGGGGEGWVPARDVYHTVFQGISELIEAEFENDFAGSRMLVKRTTQLHAFRLARCLSTEDAKSSATFTKHVFGCCHHPLSASSWLLFRRQRFDRSKRSRPVTKSTTIKPRCSVGPFATRHTSNGSHACRPTHLMSLMPLDGLTNANLECSSQNVGEGRPVCRTMGSVLALCLPIVTQTHPTGFRVDPSSSIFVSSAGEPQSVTLLTQLTWFYIFHRFLFYLASVLPQKPQKAMKHFVLIYLFFFFFTRNNSFSFGIKVQLKDASNHPRVY